MHQLDNAENICAVQLYNSTYIVNKSTWGQAKGQSILHGRKI